MLFDVVPVLLMFISLGAIVLIVGKRLPEITSLKVEDIASVQTATRKRQFLLEALEGRLNSLLSQVWANSDKTRSFLGEAISGIYNLLNQVERRGRFTTNKNKPKQTVLEILNAADKELEGKNWAEAEQLYLDVLRYDERNRAAYVGLGTVYKAQEQHEDAKESLMFALRLNKQDANSWLALAEVQVELGDIVGSIKSYETLIAEAPEVVEYKIALGDLLISQGEEQAALEVFQEVVQSEPANPRALDRLLEAAILCKKKRVAQTTLRKLKKNNPENNKIPDFEERVHNLGLS